jgi:uncharacterized protein YfiM (DUF2279 family)
MQGYISPGQDSLALQNAADSSATIKKYGPFTGRQWLVGGLTGAAYGASLLILNEAWYKQYKKTGFHTFNDSREWLQTDKVGHAWSVYHTSRSFTALWKWARIPHRNSVMLGTFSGFSYLTVVEFLDAHTERWGWSWADMGANASGAALFAVQELAWKEQRIGIKFSAHKSSYPSELQARVNDLYGTSLPELLLKDYNAQTYWLSFNLADFTKSKRLPPWLNLAAGYGADGLFGGFENRGFDKDGNITFDRRDIPRRRQWYLAPDIDFTRIPTGSKTLKTVFFCLNAVKLPTPALEYSNGKIRGHWLHF